MPSTACSEPITYETVRDVLDVAPFPVGEQDLQGRNGLAPEDGERANVCGSV